MTLNWPDVLRDIPNQSGNHIAGSTNPLRASRPATLASARSGMGLTG